MIVGLPAGGSTDITARLHRARAFHKDLYLCHFFLPRDRPDAVADARDNSALPCYDARALTRMYEHLTSVARLQTQLGYTATWAGLVAAPAGLVSVLVAPFVGRMVGKVDARLLGTVGEPGAGGVFSGAHSGRAGNCQQPGGA